MTNVILYLYSSAIASALAKQEELLAELHVKIQTTNDDEVKKELVSTLISTLSVCSFFLVFIQLFVHSFLLSFFVCLFIHIFMHSFIYPMHPWNGSSLNIVVREGRLTGESQREKEIRWEQNSVQKMSQQFWVLM